MPPAILDRNFKDIAVTRLDGLGDLVLSLGLLGGLHARFPDATIRLLVRPHMAEVRELLPSWIQVECAPFNHYDILRRVPNPRDLAAPLRTFFSGLTPDLIVLGEYSKSWVGELFALMAGEVPVLSFATHTSITHWLDDLVSELGLSSRDIPAHRHVQVETTHFTHEASKYGAMLEALGAPAEGCPVALAAPDHAIGRAKAVFGSLSLDPDETVVIFPGSNDGLLRSLTARAWPEVAAGVMRNLGCPVLFLGAASDAEALAQIRAEPGPALPSYQIGDGGLPLLVAMLGVARAYLGADTGPMHIAANLGKLTIGIFGGGHKAERFLPLGRTAFGVRMPLACYGCVWECPFPSRLCLTGISNPDVIRTVQDIWCRPERAPDPGRPCHVVDLPFNPAILPNTLHGTQKVYAQFLSANHNLESALDGLRREVAALAAKLQAEHDDRTRFRRKMRRLWRDVRRYLP